MIGFTQCKSDVCLLVRVNEDRIIIFFFHVDDSGCVRNEKAITATKEELKKFFNMKIVGEMMEYVS